MTRAILLQVKGMDLFDSLRQRFAAGGDWTDAVVVLLAFGVLFSLLLAGHTLHRRRRGEQCRPKQLFRRLLLRLDLSVPQRDLLRRLATDRRLDNPAVLLLSRGIFESHASQWADGALGRSEETARRLQELTIKLFGVG